MPPPRSPNTDRGGATSNVKGGGFSAAQFGGAPKTSASAGAAPKGGSGQIGSKGGGASQQKPGAGNNAGKVTSQNLTTAKKGLADTRSTALGKVAQAAQTNARPAVQNPVTFGGQFDNGAAPKFSQKPSWQTRPGADVMGSKPSQQAMNPAKLGLPKSTVTALNKAQTVNTPTASVSHLNKAAQAIGLNEQDKRVALQDYLKTGGVNLDPAATAWCAAFVNATLKQAGLPGTGSLMARSFLNYGTPVKEPQAGDIAVFKRGPAPYGHVGFVQSVNPDGTIELLGGNQRTATSGSRGVAVNVRTYGTGDLLGYRRPGAPAPGTISSQPGMAVPSQIGSIPGSIARAPISATQLASTAPTAIPDAGRAQRNQDALRAVTAPLQQPRMGAFQGPRMPGDPSMPRGIPAPQSTGMMPPRSFIGGDPRSGMAPGAFPAARPPSFVSGDPRAGMPPGAFPAAPRMQSPVMGDPRTGMAPGSYPAAPPRPPTMGNDPRVSMPPGAYPPARMQSPVMGDPRANLPPGTFPAKPASVFADPRVGLPTGGMPRAKPVSIVAGDPRANMRPGSYPAASQPLQTAWSVPPLGGALSAEQATGLGVWSTTRTPPAAPHLGTPASQTAEVQSDAEPSVWEQGGNWIQTKVQQAKPYVEQAAEGSKKIAELQKNPITNALLKAFLGGGGTTDPATLRGYGSTQNDNAARYLQQAGANMMMGGPALTGGGGNDPQLTPAQMTELLTAMQAKGATPEEIAYVQSLMTTQTA